MTDVLEALDEIDVGEIRRIVGNATQIFNDVDTLLTTQISNIGKEMAVGCYSVLSETENNVLCFRHQFCSQSVSGSNTERHWWRTEHYQQCEIGL